MHNCPNVVRWIRCQQRIIPTMIRWGTAGLLKKKNTYQKLYNCRRNCDVSVFVILCPLRKKMTHWSTKFGYKWTYIHMRHKQRGHNSRLKYGVSTECCYPAKHQPSPIGGDCALSQTIPSRMRTTSYKSQTLQHQCVCSSVVRPFGGQMWTCAAASSCGCLHAAAAHHVVRGPVYQCSWHSPQTRNAASSKMRLVGIKKQ